MNNLLQKYLELDLGAKQSLKRTPLEIIRKRDCY